MYKYQFSTRAQRYSLISVPLPSNISREKVCEDLARYKQEYGLS